MQKSSNTTVNLELEKSYDNNASWLYDKFKLENPEVKTNGVWKKGYVYYFYCLDINDEESFESWLYENKPIGLQVSIVASVPKEAVKLPSRTYNEVIEQKGFPFSIRYFKAMLYLELGKNFPFFIINEDQKKRAFKIITKSKLTTDEKKLFDISFSKMEIGRDYQFEIDNNLDCSSLSFRSVDKSGDIELIPSKFLFKSVSGPLRSIIEEDEEFWIDNRNIVFGNKQFDNKPLPATNWDNINGACLLDTSVFPAYNIRNYLTIFKTVILALPLKNSFEKVLHSLTISEKELIELINQGYVKIILPHAIDRYNKEILEIVAESSPHNLILSRKLTCLAIEDLKHKIPYLFPSVNTVEQQILLQTMYNVATKSNNVIVKKRLLTLVKILGEIWSSSIILAHKYGAFSIGQCLGKLASGLYKNMTGRDLIIEFGSAALPLQLGTALNSTVYPVNFENYSELLHTEYIASLYSDIPKGKTLQDASLLNVFAKDLLSVDNSVPIIEFVKSFKGGDIERLRNLFFKKQEAIASNDEFINIINNFNKTVTSYEKRKKFLSRHDIKALLPLCSALTGVIYDRPLEGVFGGFSLWFINIFDQYRGSNSTLDMILDAFEGSITMKNPNTVMLGRIKKKLKAL